MWTQFTRQLRNMLASSLAVIGLSWAWIRREKWYGTYTYKPDGSWDRRAEQVLANFSRSGHPTFRASSGFARGELRSKVGGKKSIHFNGSTEPIELLLSTVISANQLSIYGAVADLCDEVPKGIGALEKPAAPKHLEKVEIPTILSKVEELTARVRSRNCGQATSPFYEIPKYVSKNFITEASPATHAIDRFVLLRVLHFSFLFRFLLAYAAGFPVALHSYFRFFLVLDFQCICFRQIRNPVMKMMKK